ncbi:MAG: T9SS type A sorting domain-containing protein [Bacteroidales bacterium]
MKTLITNVMILFMAWASMSRLAESQQIVTTAPNLSVCPGSQNVEVPITVQNLSGVNSISLSLGFNNNTIAYVSSTSNPILSENGAMLLVNCPPPYNKVKAAYFGLTPINLPDNEVLFTFTFNVTGSSDLIWDIYTPGACQYSDFDAQPLPATFINGALMANLPDASFTSTPQICEGQEATVSIEFFNGTPPFIFTYTDNINPEITDTAYSYFESLTQTLTNSTTWNLLSITDASSCANTLVNRSTSTYVAPLASQFNVSGGGTRCENGEYLAVSLDGSQAGLVYYLYLDNASTGYWQYGTGDPLIFNQLTSAGAYSIVALNDCGEQLMNGSALISVLPLPIVTFEYLAPVCYLTEPFPLTGAWPEGGVYSGLGVENGYFHTEYYGPGSYTITYTYTDVDGCVNSVNQELSVLGLPSVYFEPLPPVCGDSDSLLLIVDPLGGVFTGPGIVNGYFYPELAGSGIHVLTYTYTDLEGCANSASQEVAVFPLPEVTISPVNDLCANDSPVELSGTPENGWFDGPGVYNNIFYPEMATAGSWTITYYYTNEFGCTNAASTEVTVMPEPVVTIEALGPFCQDAPVVDLVGTPAGGVFSGEGVQNGQFYPEVAGSGIWPIIYFYTDENGCSSSNGTDITVYTLPEVLLYPIDPVCVTGNPVTLVAWPEGGTFSGTGVEGNMFYPNIAGEGIFQIIYTYVDEQGCSNNSVQEVIVNAGPQLFFDLPSPVCVNADPFEIFPQPQGGYFTGAGIFGNWFYPADAGAGVHQITYHYSDNNGCSAEIMHEISVLPLPEIIINPVDPICLDASPVALSALPEGGVFSGYGVSQGMFYPAETGAGIWTVIYTFTDINGCTSSASIEIIVNDLPQPYFYPVDPLCINADPVQLMAWPEGGVFSGTGVENNMFYPSMAGIGVFTITYSFTNEYGCTGIVTQDITVAATATVEFSIPATVCFNSEAVELIGIPAGGWFEGTGVYGSWFYPAEAGVGTWTITYNYLDNNCSASVSHDITVLAIPSITFDEIGPFCFNNDPVVLSALPEGGSFTGTGVSNGVFSPSVAGPGYWEITYSVTDENGCSSQASVWVVVNDLPVVEIYGPENICLNADPAELIGYPEGGTFSGPGMDGNFFNPSIAGIGSHTITYVYTHVDGCSNSTSITINVNEIPVVSIEPIGPLCANQESAELTGIPSGGYFSGTGVWDNYFHPSWVGVGTYNIIYTYTHENGCSASAETTVNVNPATEIVFNPLNNICLNSAPVQLSASPAGGTFEGIGVSGDLFYPEVAGYGYWELKYFFTNEFGCNSIASIWVMVNEAPQVALYGPENLCLNADAVELTGYPEGGTFSGNGILGNVFNPAIAGTGNHAISYDFTDANGCSNTASITINVLEIPQLSINPVGPLCENNEAVELTGTPEGGYFTGTEVWNNYFYPSWAGTGTYTITYTYTDTQGCSNSIESTIVVNPITGLIFNPLPDVCLNASPVLLEALPTGGTFAGNGVVDNVFYPVQAGLGLSEITYTYTNEFGCNSIASVWVMVNEVPQLALYGPENICLNADAVELTGYPEGGTFSGNGILGNAFNPAIAGTGNHAISYDYTDANGCSNTASITINVLEIPQLSINPVGPLCENNEAVELTGTPEGGFFTGTEVWNNYFYPSWAGTGTYTITYTYTDTQGCSNSIESTIVVNPITDLIFNPLPDVCLNASPVLLEAWPTGGTFTGNGVVDNVFYPVQAGLGFSEITYTYTNENNCTSAVSQTINVNNTVEIIFNPLADVCINGGIVELVAYPEGGDFSGEGVNGNTFDPMVTGPGTFTITYNYTNEDLCEGVATQTITVLPLTDIIFNQPDDVCVNGNPVELSALPEGGTFTGQGVYNNVFYPQEAGTGTWLITYTFTNVYGCTSSLSQNITVNPISDVSIDPVGPLCVYTDPVTLAAQPEGGVFTGTGVNGNTFSPSLAGVGNWEVTYTFTNEFGCVSNSTISISVVPAPEVGIYPVDPVCENTAAFVLTGWPEGGVFSGTGVVNGMFDPSMAGAGQWIVTYSYTDNNGCYGEADILITVNENVTVTLEAVAPICNNGEPVVLSGFPVGGVFSGPGVTDNMFYPAALAPGTYVVTYSYDENNCGGTASTAIVVNPQVFVEAGDDLTILEGQSAQLTSLVSGGTEPYEYFWHPGSSLDDQFSAAPIASPAVTTTYSVMVHDAAGCMAMDEVTVNVIVVQDDIQGRLTYMNDPMTPLNNCNVILYQNGTQIASALTDNDGYYSFTNLPFGDYSLSAETAKPWGGGNALDGLLMLRHFVGTELLTGLKLQAGDVTGQGVINAHDALNTMRRFVVLLDDFSPVGDWVFEQPTLTIDGYTPQNIDFQGLCMGDVNGDNIPSNLKAQPSINAVNDGIVTVTNGVADIPVRIEQAVSIGALSLVFELPVNTEVTNVVLAGKQENVLFNQVGNTLRIAWCNLTPIEVKAGDILLIVSLKNITETNIPALQLDGASTLADDNAVVIKNSVFIIPGFSGSGDEVSVNNYPNPFSGSTQIVYSLPDDGFVTLNVYNLIGEKVTELISETQLKGSYQVNFDGSSLSQGTYLYKLEVTNASNVYQKTGLMNVSR